MIKIRLKHIMLLTIAVFCFAGCTGSETSVPAVASQDTQNSNSEWKAKAPTYSDLYLDSAVLEQFIRDPQVSEGRADDIRDFYKSRSFQFAWFEGRGLDEHGQAFWNLHNNFLNYTQDSSLFNRKLHRQMERVMNDPDTRLEEEEVRELEMALTDHFFEYAQYAFTGKVNPRDLKWFIPQKKINVVKLLDSLVAQNGQNLDKWEPLNKDYKKMRKALMRYYDIEKAGGWQTIDGEKRVYREGDTASAIKMIKNRLRITGDYPGADTSGIFTSQLALAVRNAQERFGLVQDGVAGPNTIDALNLPVTERIKQMLVNMERMRWMPSFGGGTRLVANIPEFKLHVYEGDREVMEMRIVVGKAANRTVVFTDKLEYVVFSPYWNIPSSIVRKEILPAIRRNPNYLRQNNMERTGTRNGLPVIRQKPGGDNALGRVKFIFPNSYAIYFHDTPAKSLFDENKRAFSHGCIRLSEPQRLAEYLLRNKSGWDAGRISNAMYAESEKWIKVPEPVPVAITYFTSWVNDNGQVAFRDDIYGHDRALANKLFE